MPSPGVAARWEVWFTSDDEHEPRELIGTYRDRGDAVAEQMHPKYREQWGSLSVEPGKG